MKRFLTLFGALVALLLLSLSVEAGARHRVRAVMAMSSCSAGNSVSAAPALAAPFPARAPVAVASTDVATTRFSQPGVSQASFTQHNCPCIQATGVCYCAPGQCAAGQCGQPVSSGVSQPQYGITAQSYTIPTMHYAAPPTYSGVPSYGLVPSFQSAPRYQAAPTFQRPAFGRVCRNGRCG